jgi:AmiR/NasT family two-component response regulator
MTVTLDADPLSELGRIARPELPPAIAVARLVALADSLGRANRRLQDELESRAPVEQAKGMLAERWSLDLEDARSLLERAAEASGRSVQRLARDVVSCRSTPLAIARARRDENQRDL